MNAEMATGHMLSNLANNALNFVRQRATIGITQNDPTGARLIGGDNTPQREFRVFLIAIKKMLRVEHCFIGAFGGQRNAVFYHLNIFIELDTQSDLGMEVPCLADQTDDFRFGIEDRCQPGIILGAAARPPCHTKRT